ncbi:MAG: aminotransferase class V-fold PLP-dependent enzyme, partial [Planctomycetota bacterium]
RPTSAGEPRRIYLDNAATSFPKPAAVHEAMYRYATEVGASPGRGSYAESLEGARLIEQCRSRIARLLGAPSDRHVVFSLNTSDALNIAIRGVVANRRREHPGRPIHVVTTSMDHNSVLRPLNALQADGLSPGVTWTCVDVDSTTGIADPAAIASAITRDTVLVAVVHASNVTGTLQPIERIARVTGTAGVPLLVDAAQTAGRVPIDMAGSGIDLLAFPGHKAMLGPLGTGCLVMAPGLEDRIDTIREGGTGTVSELDVMPAAMPDKYEPGSHNTPGIVGLSAGVQHLLDLGVDVIWREEQRHIKRICDAMADTDRFPGLRLLGPKTSEHRVGVFTFVHDAIDPQELAAVLEGSFGLLTRAGIHCAPRAHGTFGTRDAGGGLRASLGPFVSGADVDLLLNALAEVSVSLQRV